MLRGIREGGWQTREALGRMLSEQGCVLVVSIFRSPQPRGSHTAGEMQASQKVWRRHPAYTFLDRTQRSRSLLEGGGGWVGVGDLEDLGLKVPPPPLLLGFSGVS